MMKRLLPLMALAALMLAGCSGNDDPPPPCTGDVECRMGERCVPDGRCVFGAECVNDTECTSTDARTECNAEFQCTFREGFGDECGAGRPCPFGSFCSELLGLCLDSASSRDCTRRSQCPAGQICDRNANKCIENPGCYGEQYCEEGEFCDEVARVCRTLSLECSSCFGGIECSGGQSCFVSTQECLADRSEAACEDNEFCDPLGRCVQCTRSSDCGVGLFCNPSVGRCERNIQCADDPSSCPDSEEVMCVLCTIPEVCDPRTRRCSAPPTPCANDTECDTGQLCDLNLDPPICVQRIPDCLNDLFDEPVRNDAAAAASLLPVDEGPDFEELKLCPADADWYRIDVNAGTYLTIDARFTQDIGDLEMQLFLADGRTLLDEARSVTDNERVELEVGTDLTLLLRVFFASPTIRPVPYRLIVARDPGALCPDDAVEPDDEASQATTLVANRPAEGRVCPGDPDWFVLNGVPAGRQVELDLDFVDSLGDLDLEIYRPGASLPFLTRAGIADGESVAFAAPFGGAFYVRVVGKAADTNVYTLTAQVRDVGGPVCIDDPAEPNDSPMTATGTTSVIGRAFRGSICASDEDWFRMVLGVGQGFRVNLSFDATADLDLRLYEGDVTDPNTTPLEASEGITTRENLGIIVPDTGDYLLRVYGVNDQQISPYSLDWEVFDLNICEPDLPDQQGRGDSLADPFPLPLPPFTESDLTLCNGDPDFYQVFLPSGFQNRLRLTFVSEQTLMNMELIDPVSMQVLIDTTGFPTADNRELQINVPGPVGGFANVVVRVFATLGTGGPYTLSLDPVPVFNCQPDALEFNNLRTQATVLSSTVASIAFEDLALCASLRNVGGVGDEDWFRITPPAAGVRMRAAIEHTQGDLLMELFSPSGGPRACRNIGPNRCFSDGNGLQEMIAFTATTTEPYFLKVSSVYSSPVVTNPPTDADTPYRLQVDFSAP